MISFCRCCLDLCHAFNSVDMVDWCLMLIRWLLMIVMFLLFFWRNHSNSIQVLWMSMNWNSSHSDWGKKGSTVTTATLSVFSMAPNEPVDVGSSSDRSFCAWQSKRYHKNLNHRRWVSLKLLNENKHLQQHLYLTVSFMIQIFKIFFKKTSPPSQTKEKCQTPPPLR